MKRFFSFLIMVTLIVVIMVGCKGEDKQSTPDTSASSPGDLFNELGTVPIVKQPIKLKILTYVSSNTEDFNTNYFTEYAEKKTGIDLEFEQATTDVFKEKLNLIFASREPFDLIANANNGQTQLSKTDIMKYASQGVIRPLKKLIDENMIHYTRMLREYPMLAEFVTAPDGEIYDIPLINETLHTMYYEKMWVNKAWLDKLNMPIPDTREAFVEMLRAFKTRDPNGNGKNDEIPLTTVKGGGYYTALDGYLMNTFTFTDSVDRLRLNNGKVEASFMDPKYREGMQWLADLYKEGLIYPDSFTQSVATAQKLNDSQPENIIGASPAPHVQRLTNLSTQGKHLEYTAIPPLKDDTGKQYTPYFWFAKFWTGGAMIPPEAPNPEASLRLIDWLFSAEDEIILSMHSGEYGVAWKESEPGAKGVIGPSNYTTLAVPNDNKYYGNSGWFMRFPHYVSQERRATYYHVKDNWRTIEGSPDPASYQKYLWEETTNNYVPYALPESALFPPLYYTIEQSNELSQLQSTINTYVEESVARFITGDLSVENDWDQFLGELEKIGIQRYLQILQSAYDQSAFSK